MDVAAVKEYIISHPEVIEDVLVAAGFVKVSRYGDSYRCGYDESHTPTGTLVRCDSLFCQCFSRGFSGDLITLLMDKLHLSFVKTVQWLCRELKLDEDLSVRQSVTLPFGGFFKSIKKMSQSSEDALPTYDLEPFIQTGGVSELFVRDGISGATQEKFLVGYDFFTGRVTVPWLNAYGDLIGVMGRVNTSIVPEDVAKWFPVIPFSKTYTLYGLYQNYQRIVEKGVIFIGESEKFVMQLDTMGIEVGVALGGNAITEQRAALVRALRVGVIIVCYDEGLEMTEQLMAGLRKLKSSAFGYTNRVGYICDSSHKYLPKGSKCSPSDKGKVVFEKLLEECVVWID